MFDSVLKSLTTEYDLVGEPIFLSDFFQPDGKNKIFATLKKYHRQYYENNERILVIQHEHDEYDIEPDAGNSLIFLQNCLQKIDISNFFVIVISGNDQITTELEVIQQRHSTDQNPIKHLVVDTPFKKLTRSDSFCILPWIHLYLHTTGEIFPCCISDKGLPLGDLKTESIDTVVHNKKFNLLRKNMINGIWPKECSSCLNEEKSTGTSKRLVQNKNYEHLVDKVKSRTDSAGKIVNFDLKSVDLRFSNVCNSKCRTCSSEYSSLIQHENNLIFPDYSKTKIICSDKRKNIVEQLNPQLETLQEIYFAGGEPLLMTEHYDILKTLIVKKNTNIKIKYNTNLSTSLFYKDTNILNLWKYFDNVSLGLSIDGHDKIFEYVRHGSKWYQVLSNIERIQKECPHVKLSVTSTISLLSAESVMNLQKQWHENNTLSIDKFQIFLVRSSAEYQNQLIPGAYDLQMLYPDHKKYLAEQIDNHCEWLESVGAEQLYSDWQKVKKYMFNNDLTFCLEQFKIEHTARDHHRNEDFDELYPQFKGLFR